MLLEILKFLWKNIGTLLLAFFIALIVWIFAAISFDPNEELEYPNNINLSFIGLKENLVIVGEVPEEILTTLRAPVSVWDQLFSNQDLVYATIDLTNIDVGNYILPIDINVEIDPVRIVEVIPEEFSFRLEELKEITKIIQINVIGETALGYQLDKINLSQKTVDISGPESLIRNIEEAVALIDISGSRENGNFETEIIIKDIDGLIISGLSVSPPIIFAEQFISQVPGHRDLVVSAQTVGRQQSGYRVTSISVFPQTVSVSSSDPQLVNDMPGFVRTQALDLTNANDDIEVNLGLVLPEGVVLESEEQFILVQVGIAAIESSISLKIPIEISNLNSGLHAELSPTEIDIILSGPVPILDQLSTESIVIVVDLFELSAGIHLVAPTVITIPERINIDAINPEFIEVEIINSTEGEFDTNLILTPESGTPIP